MEKNNNELVKLIATVRHSNGKIENWIKKESFKSSENMEFKGTDWPWEFRKWDGEEWPEKRWSIGSKSGIGACVCICPRYEFETLESEANAKLISKAPELLEMLIKCRSAFRRENPINMKELELLIKEATTI